VAKKKKVEEKKVSIWKILRISLRIMGGIFMIFFLGMFMLTLLSVFFIEEIQEAGNIALIKIHGPIMGDKNGGAFSGTETSSAEIVRLIKKAEESSEVKAILLEINSPGGSAVASAEIANAVKNSNKTVVSYIREVGASGAYWVASATDKIYAHELSLTGSIGVRGSYIEYAGFLERYNFTYQRLVAGKYKDAGTPYKRLQDEERDLFQNLMDRMHDVFIREVALNRGLSEEVVRELATGFVYLGMEAKEAGLIDEFGGREEAVSYIEDLLGIEAEVGEYKPKAGLADIFGGLSSGHGYSVGRGIGDSFTTQKQFDINI